MSAPAGSSSTRRTGGRRRRRRLPRRWRRSAATASPASPSPISAKPSSASTRPASRSARPSPGWMCVPPPKSPDIGTPEVHRITGKPPNPTPAWYKLLWLKTHEPETIARTAHVVDVGGYLVHKLTGEWATSWACADPLGLVDLQRFDYDDGLLAAPACRAIGQPAVAARRHRRPAHGRMSARLLGTAGRPADRGRCRRWPVRRARLQCHAARPRLPQSRHRNRFRRLRRGLQP